MDKHLLNAMMNALTRVGNFKDAYEIWQMLSESENYDQAANNASVNIVRPRAVLFCVRFDTSH